MLNMKDQKERKFANALKEYYKSFARGYRK